MYLFKEYDLQVIVLIFVLGICIGSFLNVVIYRLPIILERKWNNLALEQLNLPQKEYVNKFDLILPRSFCPNCKQKIKFYNNIPILSYILLMGKCTYCKVKIDIIYPLVELITAVISVLLFLKFGYSIKFLGALIFSFFLILLAFIDIKDQLLPDILTLSLLWIGLLFNLQGIFVSLQESVLGAVFAYLFLWIVIKIFYLFTKKEGMGFGDLKLFSALGAWLGFNSLIPIIFISSLLALIFFIFFNNKVKTQIAFGQYLSFSGILFIFYNYNNLFW